MRRALRRADFDRGGVGPRLDLDDGGPHGPGADEALPADGTRQPALRGAGSDAGRRRSSVALEVVTPVGRGARRRGRAARMPAQTPAASPASGSPRFRVPDGGGRPAPTADTARGARASRAGTPTSRAGAWLHGTRARTPHRSPRAAQGRSVARR